MKAIKTISTTLTAIIVVVLLVAGETSLSRLLPGVGVSGTLAQEDAARPDGWTDETHGNSADPDFATVFPGDEVNTITITSAPENWQTAMDDMTALLGEFGASPDRGGFGGQRPGQRPPMGEQPEGGDLMPGGALPPDGAGPQDGARPPGGGVPGRGFDRMLGGRDDQNPVWIVADIEFEGNTWTNVGFRFKGNSSLRSSWGSGTMKLPFKLDFDEFEDDYPEIDNQRFYGFKQITFSSNFSDSSFLREKVTADIFRDAGVPSAHTAFYAVYIDYGEGPVYFGLYTAVEVIDDTVIETQFEDDDGNVYKPSGAGATFAAGTFSEEAFDKETNKDEADYSDVLALFDALNADLRTTDPAAWRANLEAVFDVDGFLNWLAVNVLVQNWDTYGNMPQNYYLYNDPTTGLLTWIPWDNNMALSSSVGMGRTLSFELAEVTADWPLIRYLMDDEVYHAQYVAYLEAALAVFEPAKMAGVYEELHTLVSPYVESETEDYTLLRSLDDFDASLAGLVEHVNARYTSGQAYVNSQAQAQ